MSKNRQETTITAPLDEQGTLTPTEPEIIAPAATGGQKTASELSPEEKERIRRMAASSTGRKFGLSRLPDGSFRLDVTIPVEIALMLESQAECAGEDLEQFIQRNVVEALNAYVASQG